MGKDTIELWRKTWVYRLSFMLTAALLVLGLPSAQAQISVHYAPGSELLQAVVVDDLPLLHTGQFIALDQQGIVQGKGSLEKQIEYLFELLNPVFKAAGSGIDQTVKLNICLKDAALREKAAVWINKQYKNHKPALSFVTGHLRHPEALIGIDAVATSAYTGKALKLFPAKGNRSKLESADAAVLPAGGAVYVSGQAAKGNIEQATQATLKQLEQTLEHLGLKKEDIVQIKSFVCPAAGIPATEKVISDFFGTSPVPPLVFVEWLSNNPVVEIELIAASAKNESKPQLEYITPPDMTASPVYAKVCKINYGKRVYLSALDMKAGNDDTPSTMRRTFDALKQVVNEVNSDMNHLVKATYYVTDKSASDALNTIRPQYYHPDRPPAASKAMVKGAGMPGASLAMDMIGVVPSTKK